MFSIVITEKGGAQRQLDFEAAEIGIGRLEDNDLCLPKNNVSKYHARLIQKEDRYVVVDRKSTNGTYVNGRRISAPVVVRRGDKIYIGDFILTLALSSAPEGIASRAWSPLPPAPEPHAVTTPTPVGTSDGRTTLERRAAPAYSPPPPGGTTDAPERRSPLPPPPAATPEAVAKRSSVPPPLPQRSSPLPPPAAVPAGLSDDPGALFDYTSPGRPASLSTTAAASPPPPAAGPTRPAPAPHEFKRAAPKRPAPHVPTNPSLPPPPAAVDLEQTLSSDSARAAALSGMTSPAVLTPALRLQGGLSMLMERLATHMNVARSEESAFPTDQQPVIERLLDQLEREGALGPDIDRKFLREAAVSEAVGLGPLDRLLGNRAVREIVVDGPTRVLADVGSGLTPVAAFFSDDSAVLVVARRLLQRAGQKLDPEQRVHEAQLPGGGSVQLLMPPLSPKGPLISVRCPARAPVTPESLVTDALLSSDMLALLRGAVQQRRSVLVLGPAGAGVSTLLSVLARFAHEHERIVSIEDTPTANLLNTQLLPLSRRALPEADLEQLLGRAAQLRPDRLLIDDLRPPEALAALLSAASTSGVLLGMHAPSPELALAVLEQFAQAGLPSHTRPGPLMAAAIQVLVHLAPDAGNVRRVRSICELQLSTAEAIELKALYRHDGKSFIASFLGG